MSEVVVEMTLQSAIQEVEPSFSELKTINMTNEAADSNVKGQNAMKVRSKTQKLDAQEEQKSFREGLTQPQVELVLKSDDIPLR